MTIDEAQNQIIEEMAAFEEWFDKYEFLVGQGKNLEGMADCFKVEENLIPGCQSRVWLRSELTGGNLRFAADSDALLTRGMVTLLLRVLSDRTPRDILAADLFFIQKTGLGSNLSPSRANGLASIVRQMKRHAEQAMAAGLG